jgi:hypothetical protein
MTWREGVICKGEITFRSEKNEGKSFVQDTQEQDLPALFWQTSGVAGPTEDEKKSRHRHSFWQHNLPESKGMAQVKPFMQRLSLALVKSRVSPLQSLSEEQFTVQ